MHPHTQEKERLVPGKERLEPEKEGLARAADGEEQGHP